MSAAPIPETDNVVEIYHVSPDKIEGLGKVGIGDIITVELVCKVTNQGLEDKGDKIYSSLQVERGEVISVGRTLRAAFAKSKQDHPPEPGSLGQEQSASVTP